MAGALGSTRCCRSSMTSCSVGDKPPFESTGGSCMPPSPSSTSSDPPPFPSPFEAPACADEPSG
eukprot:4911325-Lingulodinium_polyedra.AAC.1